MSCSTMALTLEYIYTSRQVLESDGNLTVSTSAASTRLTMMSRSGRTETILSRGDTDRILLYSRIFFTTAQREKCLKALRVCRSTLRQLSKRSFRRLNMSIADFMNPHIASSNGIPTMRRSFRCQDVVQQRFRSLLNGKPATSQLKSLTTIAFTSVPERIWRMRHRPQRVWILCC